VPLANYVSEMVHSSRSRIISDAELCSSLKAVGPLLPTIWFEGRIIDGNRRERFCGQLGIETRKLVLSRDEAPAALWQLHPERAAKLFPVRSLAEGARLYRTRAASVALLLNRVRTVESSARRAKPTRYRNAVRKCLRYLDRVEEGAEALTIKAVRDALTG